MPVLEGGGGLLAVQTEVRVVLSGIAGERFMVDRPLVSMMGKMPFFFQRVEDLGSLPEGKEHESKNQQPTDRLPSAPVSHGSKIISCRRRPGPRHDPFLDQALRVGRDLPVAGYRFRLPEGGDRGCRVPDPKSTANFRSIECRSGNSAGGASGESEGSGCGGNEESSWSDPVRICTGAEG